MEFRILGPLEVSDEGRPVEIGGPKQRALLAILLLHANRVVSRDTLIDDLWGETPPPTAGKTLQAHVSRLRRALNGADEGSSPLETRGNGYLLRVADGQLDADRFERGVEEARRELARGDARTAAEGIRAALALWRGAPLADFTYEPFAATDINRLEELRLGALEERIEADLAIGRHREVISELEALVAQHPHRERLTAQLMLALYRSDRQAEALRAYQRCRLALAEELGLEPSESLRRLECRILEHDAALAAPARSRIPGPSSRRRGALAAAGALAVSVAVVLLLTGGQQTPEPARAGGLAGVYDSSGRLLDRVALGTAPSTVAVGERGVWVLDAEDKTVSRIDPAGHDVTRTFGTASTPTDLAVGGGAVWVGNGFREEGLQGAFLPESISRIDPDTQDVVATIALNRKRAGPSLQGDAIVQQHIAVIEDAVWAINPDQTVSRIDPRVNRVVARVTGLQARTIASGGGRVWAVDGPDSVVEIDPDTNRVGRRVEIPTESLTGIAVGAGAVWVANTLGGSVWRIDPGPELRLHEIPLALGVTGIAFGDGAIWTTNEITGQVHRIDARTNRARGVSRLPAPRDVAVAPGGVWVTDGGPSPPGQELPSPSCGRLVSGAVASPDVLIVSNLPLHGTWRRATLPMVEAIRLVLERRGFKAGRYTVGYRSCDESTPQAHGFDFARCFTNARAFARHPDVLGVIGAHSSFCSYFQIPIANQAPGGPLAMVSPSNTYSGLTRPYRGMRRRELESRYPTGTRNYVRIAAADHLQAAADAELARQLGAKRLFVLSWGDDPYLEAFAGDVRTAARGAGLELAGSAAWDPDASGFRRLARRIARARADAVFIGGHLQPNGGALVRDLRGVLGREVDLIATDYFTTIPDLKAAAGRAAEGVYVSIYGRPDRDLPAEGSRFVAQFEASRGGDPGPSFAAAYAAQATEILLDAIARSDGTRASVTEQVRRTNISGGILGDVRFDAYGDLVEGHFTILRVSRGKTRNTLGLPQYSGAIADRVITVKAPSG
jgi:DNA-binding SARP family transcriptional activator/ABC-type branched-subunit amino acid transport system substrate-binding protein/DNA-binding beta-propeller fold protein YncE